MSGWLALGALVALSNGLGLALARRLPFAGEFRTRFFVLAFGVALAPFLLGLLGVLALITLPGASPAVHYGVIATVMLTLVIATRRAPALTSVEHKVDALAWILLATLAAYASVLVVDATLIPLVQSDALEYATAARRLYSLRTLSAYPPLDPVGDPSGFYGPWTHPPLYATLLYLADVSQGNADAPGLIRVMSVWALLAGAALVAAIGAFRGVRAGLLAALFFVATPALFLGADAAAIDPLTVLGVTLVLAACIAIRGDRPRDAAILGAVVGAAMWSHSQAVLLLPISLFLVVALADRRDWRALVRRCGGVAAGALLVGAWPYLTNLARMGVVVGDNPAVYALANLDWRAYFRIERNIASPIARLQYGILKGWTTLDSFALTFWFMTVGVLALRPWRARVPGTERPHGPWRTIETTLLAFLVCFYAGVVASTLVGTDILIRNERYFLFVMPAVALFAGVGADALSTYWRQLRAVRAPWAVHAVTFALLVMFSLELPVLFAYRVRRAGLSLTELAQPLELKLERWEPYTAIQAIQRIPDDGTTTLSFKPSDMFYSRRKMISFLDPRLLDVYREPDAARASQLLRGLGVSHVYVPGYASPTLYNSVLGDVLANPTLTRLELSQSGYQVYALTSGERPAHLCDTRRVGPAVMQWRWTSAYVLGGAKRLVAIRGDSGALDAGAAPVGRVAAFQRERRTALVSPLVDVGDQASELRLALEVNGSGFAHFYIEQARPDGAVVTREEAGGMLLKGGESRTYARRFVVAPSASAIRVSVEYDGESAIGVANATLSRVCGAGQ